MNLLVTGGCGFIGSHFIRHVLRCRSDVSVINLDKLTYAGNRSNLADVENEYEGKRYIFIQGDICDQELVESIFQGSQHEIVTHLNGLSLDGVVNFAAESHVDRSIDDSYPFVQTNILGVHVLLDAARKYWDIDIPSNSGELHNSNKRVFLQISTDEVYGSLGDVGKFSEDGPIRPNSPYAASKAAADMMTRSYNKTYGVPTIIVRSSNNYGPCQFPEKLIPLLISRAQVNQPLPIYGDGLNVRDWLFVEDNCEGLCLTLEKGVPGEVYNLPGNQEISNVDVARRIVQLMGKPESLITYVEDRPGHDWRYAMSDERIRALGWKPMVDFHEGLERTIRWYMEQP